jgi:hypothetical protein
LYLSACRFIVVRNQIVRITTSIFRKYRTTTWLLIAGHFMAMMILVSTCDVVSNESKLTGIVHYSGVEFAGSLSCRECHPALAESHQLTPHALTSASASPANVLGSFDAGKNELHLNERLKVVMDSSAAGLLQRGLVDGAEIHKKPMDIVIGSGRKGQSYLYWEDHVLYQLPVSYYSAGDTWSNSPGYPQDQLVFNRSIPGRCLECHSTFFRTEGGSAGREAFDPGQALMGVDCERCHGPAGDHVNFHRRNPSEKEPKHILNPARMTRQQKLDNCALCHAGIRENILPSFSYVVGENLNDYSYATYTADSAATLDVHGNQYGLLLASQCFKMSQMDCSTCHNVHAKETGQTKLFSARCMSCHARATESFCKQPEMPGLDLASNCIDCHMPALPSRQVFLQTSGNLNATPFYVRTHLIGVYDEKVKDLLLRK